MSNDVLELDQQSADIENQAQKITVIDQVSYDSAQEFLQSIRGLKQKITDSYRPIISAQHTAWKEAIAQEKRHLEPLKNAEEVVKSALLDWLDIQAKLRIEQERKLREKADKERQEAMKKADEARATGNEKRAEKYTEKAASIIAPTLAPNVNKGASSVRTYYSAEVYDLPALIKAVADGKVPINAIQANQVFLNAQAELLKETMIIYPVPGVRVVSRQGLTTRAK